MRVAASLVWVVWLGGCGPLFSPQPRDAGLTPDGGDTDNPPKAAAVQLALGWQHMCARLEDGTVVCWGTVIGLQADPAPRVVTRQVVQLSAGYNFSCSVTDQGKAECWGANFNSQLGDGSSVSSLSPVTVGLPAKATGISAGSAFGACALLEGGQVACWGANSSGQAGVSRASAVVRVPTVVPGVAGATALATSLSTTMAQFPDGGVWVWGFGQISGEDERPRSFPVLGATRALAVGQLHSCALLDTGRLHCWGRASEGQLGFDAGSRDWQSGIVPGIADVTSVCVARAHTCAVQSDGGTRCWGDNTWGQLGTGNFVPVSVPSVVELTAASAVYCQEKYSCALTDQGAFCWGDNAAGQFGMQTPASTTRPVPLTVLR